MLRWIPGHVKAVWHRFLVFPVFAYIGTGEVIAAAGVFVFFAGLFFEDQTVHLDQPAHHDDADTAIERAMQRHRKTWRYGGLIVLTLGVYMMLLGLAAVLRA
jgi:hypothetical protein